MKTHLIFIIQAYEYESPAEHLGDVVTVELIDHSAESALSRAKTLILKKNYRIQSIIEKTELCESHKT